MGSVPVNNKHYYRWQLPLAPSAAITTHKAQGITATYGVVYSLPEDWTTSMLPYQDAQVLICYFYLII